MTGYLPGLEGAAKASYAEPESSQNPLTLLNCKDKESNKKHESSTIENENEQSYELPDLIVETNMGGADLVERRENITKEAKFAIVPLNQFSIKNGINAKDLDLQNWSQEYLRSSFR